MQQKQTAKKSKRELTQENIEKSFLELLQKKSYDEITVQEILNQAKINRSTFYRHFLNKTKLTQSIIERFKKNFFEIALKQRLSNDPFDLVSFINQEIGPYRKELFSLFQIRHPKINFKNEIYQLIKSRYQQELQQTEEHTPGIDFNFQSHLYASHVIAGLFYFLENPEVQPQELWYNIKLFIERTLKDLEKIISMTQTNAP